MHNLSTLTVSDVIQSSILFACSRHCSKSIPATIKRVKIFVCKTHPLWKILQLSQNEEIAKSQISRTALMFSLKYFGHLLKLRFRLFRKDLVLDLSPIFQLFCFVWIFDCGLRSFSEQERRSWNIENYGKFKSQNWKQMKLYREIFIYHYSTWNLN